MTLSAKEASRSSALKPGAAREVLTRVLQALENKFYKPELLDEEWRTSVERHRTAIENAGTEEALEHGVTELLGLLKTSHLGFFHQSAKRASSRAALSATYLAEETESGPRWVFQDVHEGGAAALAGIRSGDILLDVNGKKIVPPEHPVFPMGRSSEVEIHAAEGSKQLVTVTVAVSKGKKLQFVEPTLVQSRKLSDATGYLKVAMFPGMIGVVVANQIT